MYLRQNLIGLYMIADCRKLRYVKFYKIEQIRYALII